MTYTSGSKTIQCLPKILGILGRRLRHLSPLVKCRKYHRRKNSLTSLTTFICCFLSEIPYVHAQVHVGCMASVIRIYVLTFANVNEGKQTNCAFNVLIGDTSSNGGVPIAMLVYRSVAPLARASGAVKKHLFHTSFASQSSVSAKSKHPCCTPSRAFFSNTIHQVTLLQGFLTKVK